MNTILALDTSGPSLSVALLRDARIVFECTQQNGLTHSDGLMPAIDMALRSVGLMPDGIDAFAVVVGPGSFTGVRIGVATAQALARAVGKPCFSIHALEALAAGASLFDGTVCPMQDARAGQVYCAAFRQGERVMQDAAEPLEEFLAKVADFGRCCFVGDGAVRHREAIVALVGERAVFPSAADMALRASHAALLAASRPEMAAGPEALLPYYLRAPQAERERAAREGSNG